MSYRLKLLELKSREDARRIREVFESYGAWVSVDLKHGCIDLDTDLSVPEIFEIASEAGFDPCDLDLL